jgi:hypothetical protein
MPLIDGRTAHRAVNLARLLQGYAATSEPPAVSTYLSGDAVTIRAAEGGEPPVYPLLVGVEAEWTRDTDPGTGDHVLMVWTQPRTTEQARKWCLAGYRWCGWTLIEVGNPIRLDSIVNKPGLVVPGGYLCLILGIAQAGLSPFFRCRACLRNGAV